MLTDVELLGPLSVARARVLSCEVNVSALGLLSAEFMMASL